MIWCWCWCCRRCRCFTTRTFHWWILTRIVGWCLLCCASLSCCLSFKVAARCIKRKTLMKTETHTSRHQNIVYKIRYSPNSEWVLFYFSTRLVTWCSFYTCIHRTEQFGSRKKELSLLTGERENHVEFFFHQTCAKVVSGLPMGMSIVPNVDWLRSTHIRRGASMIWWSRWGINSWDAFADAHTMSTATWIEWISLLRASVMKATLTTFIVM